MTTSAGGLAPAEAGAFGVGVGRVRGVALRASQRAAAGRPAALAAYRASLRAAAARFGVAPATIEVRRGRLYRNPPAKVVLARRAALYLSVVVFDRPLREIARASRTSPECVRKALIAIEDRREDPAFEAVLGDLEKELRAC